MKIETEAEFAEMIEAGKQCHLTGTWPQLALSKICGKYYASTPNLKNGNKSHKGRRSGKKGCHDTVEELWAVRMKYSGSELHCFATGEAA